MVSTSDRRSGSSGPSKRRRNVYVSTAPQDRATADAAARRGRGSAEGGLPRPAAVRSGAGAERAAALRAQRARRMTVQRRVRRLRAFGLAAAVLLLFSGCVAVYNSSAFAVRSIEVVGASHITTEAVRALARVPADATLIRFPADAVARRVAADPWVASVSVSRVFPSGMRIRVVERVPVAMVDAGSAVWLIDAGGSTIARPTAESSDTVPVIRDVPGLDLKPGRRTTSEPLLNALKVLTGVSRTLASTIRSISAPTVDGCALTTAGNVEIVIGEAADLSVKDSLARRILEEQKGKVVSIDVRITDRPTWRGLK